jgi:hypothetical protein
MRYASQLRFQLEMGLIELAHIAKLRPIEDLIAEFSAAEGSDSPRNSESPPVPVPPASVTSNSSPATVKPGPRRPAAAAREKFAVPEPERTAPSMPPAAEVSQPAAPVADPRNLLFKIAAAVGRESLESLLQTLEGAILREGQLVLQTGSANEFVRRQIKDNLPAIAQAATRVIGSNVAVVLGEPASRPDQNPQGGQNVQSDDSNLLEKAKREPIVKSFLDVFPGPVKAEKIDS